MRSIQKINLEERFFYIPSVIENVELEEEISIDWMEKNGEKLDCTLIDLSSNTTVVEQQQNERVLIREYFQQRKENSKLYCTEIYMRKVEEISQKEIRKYPPFFQNNWFITDQSSMMESIFLGDRGTRFLSSKI